MSGIVLNHWRRQLKKLLPFLPVIEYEFDIGPDLVVAGLGLDNRQLPRPIGLDLQQHHTAVYRHDETVLEWDG